MKWPPGRTRFTPVHRLGFYIHHQGAGHLIRALTLAETLRADFTITFLGSALDRGLPIPAYIECIHLDSDYDETVAENDVYPPVFHYAPLNVAGLRRRNAQISTWFIDAYPCMLIVDVSVEVTLLARLSGIPTVVMRLHGKRDDPAHLAAYASASLLVAPFGEELEDADTPPAVKAKTFYSGGFSRYSDREDPGNGNRNAVCVVPGGGGSALSFSILEKMALDLPEKQFFVLAESPDRALPDNLIYTGWQADPYPWLSRAAYIVGSAGDNGTMEAASLKRRFICIVEERPFDEQIYKSRHLERLGAAVVVRDVSACDWRAVFEAAEQIDPAQIAQLIDPAAPDHIRMRLLSLAGELFNNPNGPR